VVTDVAHTGVRSLLEPRLVSPGISEFSSVDGVDGDTTLRQSVGASSFHLVLNSVMFSESKLFGTRVLGWNFLLTLHIYPHHPSLPIFTPGQGGIMRFGVA